MPRALLIQSQTLYGARGNVENVVAMTLNRAPHGGRGAECARMCARTTSSGLAFKQHARSFHYVQHGLRVWPLVGRTER